MRKLTWLIAHEPVELFQRTVKAFQEELDKVIPGEYQIKALTVPEYVDLHPELDVLKAIPGGNLGQRNLAVESLFTALDDDIDLSQTQVNVVSAKNKLFRILDLPFLFNNHDHATKVLDGEIGTEICNHLEETSDYKALGFTYSGGYRVVGSNHKISNLEQLRLEKIIVAGTKEHRGPREDTFKAIGAFPVVISPHLWAGYDNVYGSNDATAIETTYLRFKGTHIIKTNHSMFITTIISSKKFWNSLSEDHQDIFRKVIKNVARIEREWAIKEAEIYEQKFKENGVEITELNVNDTHIMRFTSKYLVYPYYKKRYGNLVDRIDACDTVH
jgi:hypothetical protein